MKKLFKTLFVMIIVGAVVAAVASYMSKKRLESMSDDEIREFLAAKLDGKVADEQLATIQAAVIGGIRGKAPDEEAGPVDEPTEATDVDQEESSDEAETSDEEAADESVEKESAE